MRERVMVVVFGVVSYLAALAVFAWLIAYCGGVIVPGGGADGGTAAAAGGWRAWAVDVALMVLFGVQHSVMARPAVKRRLVGVVPRAAERSLFVLLASAALGLLLWQWRPLPGALWHAATGWPYALLGALFVAAWLGVLACTFLVGHFDLLGLRQVTLHLRGAPYAPLPFKESGAYRLVRHPLMLAFLAAFWVAPVMPWGHALLALGMSAYILVGVAFEERDLERDLGERYRSYRARVPMLVPRPGRSLRAPRAGAAVDRRPRDG